MMKQFPLFQTPIDCAHQYWKQLVKTGDIVVDATCGNGKDSLFLAQLALAADRGSLIAIDLQEKAIQATQNLLKQNLPPEDFQRIEFIQGDHAYLSAFLGERRPKLIVYNLGYLPGADKNLTTLVSSTLRSLEEACEILSPGGILSITCYPGHTEGAKEEKEIDQWASRLDPKVWSCCQHRWINRKNSPSLLLIQNM